MQEHSANESPQEPSREGTLGHPLPPSDKIDYRALQGVLEGSGQRSVSSDRVNRGVNHYKWSEILLDPMKGAYRLSPETMRRFAALLAKRRRRLLHNHPKQRKVRRRQVYMSWNERNKDRKRLWSYANCYTVAYRYGRMKKKYGNRLMFSLEELESLWLDVSKRNRIFLSQIQFRVCDPSLLHICIDSIYILDKKNLKKRYV